MEWFKAGSLELLKNQLSEGSYPGYPVKRLTVNDGIYRLGEYGRLYLPNGPWHALSEHNEYVDEEEVGDFYAKGYALDTENRPLHPWINDMLAPDIGVVTGKGFYREFGANRTADPIVFRHDYREPLILLVKRRDTGKWALPGGFVEPGETGEQAAFREGEEETLLPLRSYGPVVAEVYEGPMADIRVTANAWPETTAVGIHLHPQLTKDLPLGEFPGNKEEVEAAGWFPIAVSRGQLFGSHNLLVQLAINQTMD